jgi:dihydrofolate synthase/folylpolyglutamate synthase
MILSYQDALKYLYDNLPMFQRVGSVAFKKDLANTLTLCKVLGNPQHQFKSIHIAGTNGKGSTSHMLASVLQASGYKTGLYTSPHLKEFTERIKIDGKEVSRQFVLEFVNRIKPVIEEVRPSFFEITVVMAFDYFAQQGVDIAVVEVGLGGRLDSTNVITPLVSVITNISWDHKELLGNTLQEIAREKAGIIKKRVPVVISERQQEVQEVFVNKAKAEETEIFFASDEYVVELKPEVQTMNILKAKKILMEDVKFPLRGYYQKKNVPGVLKTIDLLRDHFQVDEGRLRKGLEEVIANTGLKGRWQILSINPAVVCDTAHNSSGVREIIQQIASMPFNNLHIIWGMVKDKDISQILGLLPEKAIYYFCQANIPRAMEAKILQQEAMKYGLHGIAIPDVNEAKKTALAKALKDDLIFIGGSTYVVAEIAEL